MTLPVSIRCQCVDRGSVTLSHLFLIVDGTSKHSGGCPKKPVIKEQQQQLTGGVLSLVFRPNLDGIQNLTAEFLADQRGVEFGAVLPFNVPLNWFVWNWIFLSSIGPPVSLFTSLFTFLQMSMVYR